MTVRDFDDGRTASTAVYSDNERYRYALTRIWDAAGPRQLVVMLNPSTADERRNDPTVARCELRARRMGYGGVRIVNLFGWRTPDARALAGLADPVGPENDAAIAEGAGWAQDILCAWGNLGRLRGRAATVAALLHAAGRPLWRLGVTRLGQPRHPLYVPAVRMPEPWDQA